ncbi:MAG: NAD(+) synthase [Oscillospiraceae bacterium]|nr:NAD(+) synthase [Oscillospiraceae bacterium]
MKDGFIKVAAASPMIKVADTDYNADRVIECIKNASEKGVKIIVFPELVLTGCSCYDLFGHKVLLRGAEKALMKVMDATEGMDILAVVGLPFAPAGGSVYSCAAVLQNGDLLGLVPRTEVNGTAFAPADFDGSEVLVGGRVYTGFDTEQLFTCETIPGLSLAVELGADADAIDSPTNRHALSGATVIASLASFPATVTSAGEATDSMRYRSGHLKAGMLLAAPGKGESTTDNVFSGLCMIAENGVILASDETEDCFVVSELDIDYLENLRLREKKFASCRFPHERIYWSCEMAETELTRVYRKLPHLPELEKDMGNYCRRMIDIQVSGLVKRMQYAGLDHCVVGISGGVDSTLCVMICAMAMKRLGLPSTNVVACTLPCFGTSSRTKSNAIIVAEQVGAEVRVIDIGESVYKHFDDIGHAHDDYSIAFENAQARERTQVLMDIANKVNGLDVGTEDLSEFVDGWCTYNGDHTSMYDVNMGLTKTQVRAGVKYIAQHTEDKVLADALWDVLDCPVTPELLPITNDEIEQKSEENVGSYSLQDYFTHKIAICGFSPAKTLRLAKLTWHDEFSDEELVKWLTSYCKRFFSQQFKRSCLMDGPAVEAFSVSPRNGFLIPSDAENSLFLSSLEE